jgi:hypothetical protein
MTYKVSMFGMAPLRMEGRHVSPMDVMGFDIPAYDVVQSCLKDIQKNPDAHWQNMELLQGCIERLMLAYNDLEATKGE